MQQQCEWEPCADRATINVRSVGALVRNDDLCIEHASRERDNLISAGCLVYLAAIPPECPPEYGEASYYDAHKGEWVNVQHGKLLGCIVCGKPCRVAHAVERVWCDEHAVDDTPPETAVSPSVLLASMLGDDIDLYCDMRDLLIFRLDSGSAVDDMIVEGNLNSDRHDVLRQINDVLDKFDTEALTALALELSLCPLHFRDYAICFDDDDPECAAIRTVHPAHDT